MELSTNPLPALMTEEEFVKLDVADRRRLIMQDVIDHVRAGRLVATKGTYLSFDDVDGSREIRAIENWYEAQISSLEVREKVARNKCVVCARGAIFYSSVMRTNNCTLKDLSDCQEERRLDDALGVFKFFELKNIEGIFEGWGVTCSMRMSDEDYAMGATNYFHRFANHGERLVAIALCIIKNGKFDPTTVIEPSEVEAAMAGKR